MEEKIIEECFCVGVMKEKKAKSGGKNRKKGEIRKVRKWVESRKEGSEGS